MGHPRKQTLTNGSSIYLNVMPTARQRDRSTELAEELHGISGWWEVLTGPPELRGLLNCPSTLIPAAPSHLMGACAGATLPAVLMSFRQSTMRLLGKANRADPSQISPSNMFIPLPYSPS